MPFWRIQCLLLVALAGGGACGGSEAQDLRAAPRGAYTVTVNQPAKLTSVESGRRDPLGRPQRVLCATCHSLRDAGPLPPSTGDLKEFHRGLRFSHGTVSCGSCHVPGPQVHERLRLADGATVPMTEVMLLCAQCHGPQYRDYQHGSHGGMTGYWDLRQGPRQRNNCVDCHDPHAPQIPQVRPVLPPRDRFLTPRSPGGLH